MGARQVQGVTPDLYTPEAQRIESEVGQCLRGLAGVALPGVVSVNPVADFTSGHLPVQSVKTGAAQQFAPVRVPDQVAQLAALGKGFGGGGHVGGVSGLVQWLLRPDHPAPQLRQ